MSENGLVDPETETTDLKIQALDGPRTEERSAGDERLFAWRANYLGRKRSPYRKLAGAGAWLGLAGLAGILGAFVLTPDTTLSSTQPALAGVVTPTAELAAEDVVQETPKTPMAAAEASDYDPEIVQESVKLWMLEGHAWVQFDYASDVPIYLHWFDAEGRSSLNPIECKSRLGQGMRRCYFGRSFGRINLSLSRGYTPGEWGIFACEDYEGTACTKVGTWEIPAEL